jgi:hypothetical protein
VCLHVTNYITQDVTQGYMIRILLFIASDVLQQLEFQLC